MMKINKLTAGRNLLWESSRMMLPEHKEQILQHRSRLEHKEKPVLDEHRLQELSQAITDAMMHGWAATVTLYDPVEPQSVTGRVLTIDPLGRKLILSWDGEKRSVPLSDIMDITMSEPEK
ncbi:YolD-like family protein [Paenibacillus gansuensis]|uniref:YolD-like family protein n=1 Tax=Paenibacillus gansuensis TaxID=306542 RepID=A0ABW5PED5_9BACL